MIKLYDPREICMAFSAYLKKLRLQSGESLQQVADAIGLSKAHVWELETGKSRNPTKDVLERLSNHFKVSISILLGESEESDDTDLDVMFRQLRDIGPEERAHIQALMDSMRAKKKAQ